MYVSIKGIIAVLAMFITSVLISTNVWFPAFVLLLPLSNYYYRRFVDITGQYWFGVVILCIEKIYGIKFVFTGDHIDCNENAVIVSNHPTRLDWMFLWSLGQRANILSTLKIISKRGLKLLPGMGWGMQFLGFFFLARKWEDDQGYISDVLLYYNSIKYPIQLLIFPEGTNLSAANKRKSEDYAKKNGLEIYNNILHPRTTGTEFIIDKLEPRLNAIYNLTISYPDIFPESETVLLSAKTPREIYVDIQRIPIAAFPIESERAAWIKSEWKRKEAVLNELPSAPNPIQFNKNSILTQTIIFWIVHFIALIYFGTSALIYIGIVGCIIAAVTFLGGFDYFEQRMKQEDQ